MALLISARELASVLGQGGLVVVDCRFDLLKPSAGRAAWLKGHIPGAFHADLDRDLAAAPTAESGRHPLPNGPDFAALLGSWGVEPDTHVVAYDDSGGAIAVRLWWLLHWAGHKNVSVLDGGMTAWLAAGGELSDQQPLLAEGHYPIRPGSKATVPVHELEYELAKGSLTLVDARDEGRFAGQIEPIDTRAGHIPGSLNRPFQENLSAGLFKQPSELRAEFEALLAGRMDRALAFSCGSGVTACHNLFALELSGLQTLEPRLYVGSWSEWIRSPDRPCVP